MADLQIAHVKPSALKPAPYNPRRMTDEARARLQRGIEQFGIVDPIVARKRDKLVIGGHQRLEVAKALKLKTVPVVYVDVDDSQAAALNVLLNNPSAQGEWDFGKLTELLSGLDGNGFDATLTGFDDVELAKILGHIGEVPFPGLPDGDKSPFEQMTFTLSSDQANTVREALEAAKDAGPFVDTGNENGNGNALARIAEMALEALHANR